MRDRTCGSFKLDSMYLLYVGILNKINVRFGRTERLCDGIMTCIKSLYYTTRQNRVKFIELIIIIERTASTSRAAAGVPNTHTYYTVANNSFANNREERLQVGRYTRRTVLL